MFKSDINYPKVSVIVPFYNSSETIDETLCSVEAQTYPSVEIIVVNDGSNEYHSNKLKQILSNRPHVQLVEQSNKGPASARNLGARQAVGVYFCFLDSDDVIKPQYLSACAEVLKDPKIKLVYTKAAFFGAREGNWTLPPYEGLKSILLGNRIPNAVALQRSKGFFELSGFDESLRTHEDWDYWIRLLQNEGDVVCIQEVLFMYRKRSDGTSLMDQLEREPRRIQEDWQKIYDKHRSLYLQHNLGYYDLIVQLNNIENQLESANQLSQMLKAQLDEMIQLNGQLDRRYQKYKKLWSVRLMKPIIKTEQAISSANTLRKGFRNLVKEKGSIGKAYQFLRRLRKDESMKEVKKYLKTGVFTGGSSLNRAFERLDGGNSSNEKGFYESLFSQTSKSNQYVNMRENISPVQSNVKLIAFYLPQFHPIPENDKAWGKGFTEWTNVSKAVPQYVGHHQPKLPDELGFYDLRLIEVQKRQIELAKSYGIYGFCYHHYWFDGKRVMDRPIEQILAHPELDFPFCINWANENWTKKWDGRDADVLLAQNHSELDDVAFIEDAARYMRDSRYIRIDGKPLLMLYRPSLLVDPKATGERWRTWCRENGIGELYLVITHSFEPIDPETIGFDAAVEFAPNSFPLTNVTNKMRSSFLNSNFDGVLYDYTSAIDYSESYRVPHYTKFRGVCPRWDNEARKPGKGTVLIGSNPVEYGKWLQSICRFTKNNFEPSKQFVFINAWNEWAEGAYLEPDRKYGYAYLEATRNSLLMTELSTSQKIAIVVHAFYPDVFEEIAKYIIDISQSIKLFVTTTEHNKIIIKEIASKYSLDVDIIIVKNKGRDMLPFLKVLPIIKAAGYPFILKIHTKKSKHRADGEIWRSDLYEKLLRPERFEKALSVLSTNLNIGVVGPEGHIVDMNTYWGSNKHAVLNLSEKMNVAKEEVLRVPFVAGSMFYARTDALECLLELGLTDDDFEEESGQIDGTLAHAIERLIGVSAICNQQIIASIDGETNYVKNYGFVN